MRDVKGIGTLVGAGFGVIGFVWGMRHISEPRGLFVLLTGCSLLYDAYRRWDPPDPP